MTDFPLESDDEDLYENAPCGYLSTTLDGMIVRANRTFLESVGYRAEDLVGKKRFVDLLSAAGRIYHETHYAPLLKMQGSVREIAIDIVTADGSRFPALIDAVVRDLRSGSPPVVRVSVFRATDRREYERELLRARRQAEESEERARLLAETLQASLLPPALPEIPGLELGAGFRPAGTGHEVGGDFYDVFEIGPRNWAVVIGDARGKGAEAATVTALARYTVRAAAVHAARPSDILRLLNAAMLRQNVDTFVTIGYVDLRIQPEGRGVEVTVTSGGHPLPVVLRQTQPPHSLGEPGTVIGVLEEPILNEETITLGAGEGLVLYTDGVTEGRHGDDFFGDQRMIELLDETRSLAAPDIAARLLQEVVDFQEGHPRDDIATVVVKVPGDVRAS